MKETSKNCCDESGRGCGQHCLSLKWRWFLSALIVMALFFFLRPLIIEQMTERAGVYESHAAQSDALRMYKKILFLDKNNTKALSHLMAVPLVQKRKINVIATTSIVGDIVRNVGGNAIVLKVLVESDGDAHEFEPVPADSVHLARADVIFENGLHLESWLDKLFTASGSKARRIVVSKGVLPRTFSDNGKDIDPHAWQNVANVIIYTHNVCNALSVLDPVDADVFQKNADNYIQQLKTLDGWIRRQVAEIPMAQRKLVTNHDAFGYFADAYGFKIIGTVIPSATTEAADPSARQTAQLLNLIRANDVHAVFSENMANPKLVQALAAEAGVEFAPALYTDALGPKGSQGETYLKIMEYNVGVLKKFLK